MTRAAPLAALMVSLWLAPVALARWSSPARPSGCSTALAAAPPLVVFPSSDPTTRSGPGVLLWSAPLGCVAGATTDEAVGATLAGDDRLGLTHALSGKTTPAAGVAAVGTAAGGLVVGRGVAASAYLGDVALATPVRTRTGWAVAVRVQRHYSRTLSTPHLLPVGAEPVTALAITLDYRAEGLLVWATHGGVYAHELSSSGVAQGVTRQVALLGAGSPSPELQALLSDDGHAIVVWRTQSPAGAPPSTTIELAIAGAGLAFAAPRPLEHFLDPRRFVPPAGALRLLRLSSDAVMVAWTGLRAGRLAVLASPVSLHRGAWAPVTISGGGPGEAVLDDLAAGPDAEAVAVWRVTPRLPHGAPGGAGRAGRVGRAGPDTWAIVAARGHYAGPGEVSFDAPERVAPVGFNGPPAVAIDPATGVALAAWVSSAGAPHVEYALRAPTPTPTPTYTPASAEPATATRATSRTALAVPLTALACCLGLPYASIDSSAIRIGTPLAACLK